MTNPLNGSGSIETNGSYIGLRSDRNHLRALKCYESLIMEGACETAPCTENFTPPTGEQTGS
jgi:hypothetical protein